MAIQSREQYPARDIPRSPPPANEQTLFVSEHPHTSSPSPSFTPRSSSINKCCSNPVQHCGKSLSVSPEPSRSSPNTSPLNITHTYRGNSCTIKLVKKVPLQKDEIWGTLHPRPTCSKVLPWKFRDPPTHSSHRVVFAGPLRVTQVSGCWSRSTRPVTCHRAMAHSSACLARDWGMPPPSGKRGVQTWGGEQIESTQIAWNLGLVCAGKRKAQLRSLEAGPGWPPRAGPMKRRACGSRRACGNYCEFC